MDEQEVIDLAVGIENINYRLSLIEEKLGIADKYMEIK